jgi:hypothetical protein
MTAAWADFRPRALLQLLASRGVDHVVVGGYAAVLHGSPRITQDLDISYATDQANLDALGRALIDASARLYGIRDDVPFVPDSRTLARTELLTLQTDLGKLDLMTDPGGGPGYSLLRASAETVDLGDFAVRIASLEDLLSMKRSADRPKDRADVVELEAIGRLRRDSGS